MFSLPPDSSVERCTYCPELGQVTPYIDPAVARQMYELRKQLFMESGVPNGLDFLSYFHDELGGPEADGGESHIMKDIESGNDAYVVGGNVSYGESPIQGMLNAAFVNPKKVSSVTSKESGQPLENVGVIRCISGLIVREGLRGSGLAKLLITHCEHGTRVKLANERHRLDNPKLRAVHVFNVHPEMRDAMAVALKLVPGSIEVNASHGQGEKLQPLLDRLRHFAKIL